ncbi:MAG: FMN-binding protein [Clostridia bacterium]|nr:FMN-binding protein [Clostridia bacterium]
MRLNRMIAGLLALACLLFAFALAEEVPVDETYLTRVLPGTASLKKQSLKSKYKTDDDLGVENEVLAAWKSKDGFVVKTRVHYGAEFYEDPTMDVFVGLDKDGLITGVAIGQTVDHTAQFLETVTQDYLNGAYIGGLASSTFTTDAVSGATFSSETVLFGVQLASWYAANVFRVGERESQDIQLKKLQAVVPGTYEKVEVDEDFACDAGSVQYVATGADESGAAVTAVVAQASFTPENPDNNMAMPTYQIWLDGDGAVIRANMLSGHFYEAFPMDADKLEAYYGTVIVTGEEFDAFEGGLISEAPEYILTSASAAFPDTVTGATPAGNDTSLSVRNCFITAARYYAQVIAK